MFKAKVELKLIAVIIRQATMEDREPMKELIAESARYLSREHYNDTQIEAAIATVFGVDTDLIEDGTYFVAESDGSVSRLWRLESEEDAFRRRSVFVERCRLFRSARQSRRRFARSLFIRITRARELRERSWHDVREKRGHRVFANSS